ncbi:hypothetical protein H0I31_09895 [Tenacibaculum sp. AHE15PA]|uniref:hypothetical protein n=1 Tax=unclassified Tenacibaculum TaxID=2635139 RepID=UPI001C500B60|nr:MULTISPECIES: hypothetical protein [unclassified Tenacibaculum]QXP74145.1 hypothetical protein H0I30_03085 [Tenacibaculum sp. AHE14PA]QXP75487.1 hypothetical protein H0I31_09895 [Tenacibaculum sp. AHE15PA]
MIKKKYQNSIKILSVLLLLLIGVNFYISTKVEKFLLKKSIENKITFTGNVSTNVLFGNVSVNNIVIKKGSLEVEVESVLLKGFSYYSYFKNKKISADLVQLNTLELQGKLLKDIVNKSTKGSTKTNATEIEIGAVEVNGLKVDVIDLKNNFLKVEEVVLKVTEVKYDTSLKNAIPFLYKEMFVSVNNFERKTSETQAFKIGNLSFENSKLTIDSLEIVPLKSRKNYIYHVAYETDLLSLFIKKINIPELKVINKEKLFFEAKQLFIDEGDFNVYLNGTVLEDANERKDLYSKSLRELPFELKLDTVKISNSKIVYEELADVERKAGLISFHKINATISNLLNIKVKDSFPTTKVIINCSFMNTSPLEIDWRFNVGSLNDAFQIKGKLGAVYSDKINSFIKPNLNVELDGEISKLFFNFYGNDTESNGDFAIQYKGLKVKVLNKDRQIKKLVSWITSLIVKNSSKDGIEKVKILKLERNKTRSFWNFLWENIKESLKKILL